MAIGAVLGGISTAVGLGNSLGLGSVDPTKERERIATIDTLKRDAIQSRSKSSLPYVRLACLAGAGQGSDSYSLAVTMGLVEPGQPCRIGSDSALAYAKAAKVAVDAALAFGNTVVPIITDVTVDHIKQQAVTALPYILAAVVLVGAVAYFARKGG